MIEVRSLFNGAARATGTALANGFARVALSPPGQIFVRNAGFFTSASNIAANTLLGFRFPWASAAFFAQEPGWALNNLKDRLCDGKIRLHLNPFEPDDRGIEITLPDSIANAVNAAAPHGKKWAGGMALLGSSLFLAQSWTAGDMHALPLGAAMLLAVSTAASMSQSAAAIFEHSFNHAADGSRRYPLVATTLLDVTFGSGLFTATEAFGAHPYLMVPIGLLLMTGDAGIFCQDDSLLAWLDAKKAENAARVTPDNFLTFARRDGLAASPTPPAPPSPSPPAA